MMQIAKSVFLVGWRAIVLLGSLLGIFYIPENIQGLAEIYPWLPGMVAMVEPIHLVTTLCVLLIGYVLWMDTRPYRKMWFRPSTVALGAECRLLADQIFEEIERWQEIESRRFFARNRDQQRMLEDMDERHAIQMKKIAALKRKFNGPVEYHFSQLRNIGVDAPVVEASEYYMEDIATFLAAAGSALEHKNIDAAQGALPSLTERLRD